MRKFLFIAFIFICFGGQAQSSSPPPMLINTNNAYAIIVYGQSNALGTFGDLTTLPIGYWAPTNVATFNGSSFVTLSCYTNNNQQPTTMQDGSWSFPTPLAAKLSQYTGCEVYLIQYTVGGSILYDTSWLGGRCWSPDRRGELFDSAVAFTNRAFDWLDVNVGDWRLAGLVWDQWESDASMLITARNYDHSLSDFVDSLRIAITQPNLYIWLGKPSDNATNAYVAYKDTLLVYYNDYVSDPTTMTEFVNKDDLPFYADNLHFSPVGNIMYSERVLDSIKPLIRLTVSP